MGIWIISRLTFRESLRRKIALTAIVLGFAFLILFSIGFHFIHREIKASAPMELFVVGMRNFLATTGLYAVNFLTVVMAALIAADTLAGEIDSGVIQSIVSKPIFRREVLLGKWLGFAILLAIYTGVMAGGVVFSVWIQSGYLVPNPIQGIAYIYLSSLVIMSTTIAFSSIFSTLATGGAIFGMYGIAFIGGWVEQIGSFVKSQTAVDIGIICSLIMPSEAVWRRASYEMTSRLLYAIGGFTPLVPSTSPSLLMIGYAVLYLLVALFLAARQLDRRDL